VVSAHNDFSKPYNVTAVTGVLTSAQNYDVQFQNFTPRVRPLATGFVVHGDLRMGVISTANCSGGRFHHLPLCNGDNLSLDNALQYQPFYSCVLRSRSFRQWHSPVQFYFQVVHPGDELNMDYVFQPLAMLAQGGPREFQVALHLHYTDNEGAWAIVWPARISLVAKL